MNTVLQIYNETPSGIYKLITILKSSTKKRQIWYQNQVFRLNGFKNTNKRIFASAISHPRLEKGLTTRGSSYR